MAYSLQKYTGPLTKHMCPACKRTRCFVYYVNEAGVALHQTVGRCDHQTKCGYHKKPRDFFSEHPEIEIPESWKTPAPIPERKLWIIDKGQVKRYRSNESTLLQFLMTRFNPDRVREVAAMYQIGANANGSTIFWQIDKDGRTRTGKLMAYGRDGHRIKEDCYDRVNWMHAILRREGLIPEEFELTQCLFVEHLLRIFPDAPVVLVESEKTAIICAIKDSSRVYLATGGVYGLTAERAAALVGRHVIVIPDADAMDEWRERVEGMQRLYDIFVGDPGYTEEDKIKKRDIADLILQNQDNGII